MFHPFLKFARSARNRILLLALLLTLFTACGPQNTPAPVGGDEGPSLNLPFLPAPGADTLAPQAAGLVVSSTPTDGATGVSSSAPLQLTLSSAANKTKVETAYALYPGKYDPSSTPASFTKLGLTSMCAGRLRVRNPNAFPLSFQWDAYNTPERGVGVVPASSDVFFTASPTATIRVFVGTGLQNTKAQNTSVCGPRDFTPIWSADSKSVSLQPATPLTVGQDYTLTLSTLAADTSGSTLAAPLAVRFDTRVSNTGGDPSQLNLGVRVLPSFAGLEFSNVDGGLALSFSSSTPVWNPASKVFSAQITAKNTSSAPYANIRAILKTFAPGNVSVVSPSGFTGDNLPFVDFGSLAAGESKTLTWKFYAPDAQPFTFAAGALSLSAAQNTLALSSVSPSSLANNVTTSVTLQGAGIRQETAFFIESTRLTVSSWTPTSTTVSVPYGFLPGSYGIMAVNPDGTRAVLYPALSIAEGPKPRAADPREHAFSFADGFVLDYSTKQGIVGAKITAKIVTAGGVQSLSTTSVAGGYYLLRGLPVGTHQVKIEAPGFEPVYRTAVISDPGDDPSKGATVHLKYAALEPTAAQTTLIGAAGGTHYASNQGENGPFLVIPPGALDSPAPIRFTHLRAAETLPELPQDGYYLAFARLEPVGLTFKKPATLYLPLQAGIKLENGTPIKISYFDARENRWVQDITAGTIVTRANGKQYLEYEINHFTWIGGQWNPDPVEACVKYAGGQPAIGAQTNWGVTGTDGIARGSTTRSNINQTLQASVIGRPNIAPVSFAYSGSGPVKFPCLILPEPAPLKITVPKAETANCPKGSGSLFPFSVPVGPISAQSLPNTISSGTLTAQSASGGCGSAGDGDSTNTTEPTWVISGNTLSFRTTASGTGADPATIRVLMVGQNVSSQLNIKALAPDTFCIELILARPMAAGVKQLIAASISATTATGKVEATASLSVDAVTKMQTPRASGVVLANDTPLPFATPYVLRNEGTLTYVYRESDVVNGKISVPLEIQALDELGKPIAANSPQPLSLSDLPPGTTLSSTKLVGGMYGPTLIVPVDASTQYGSVDISSLKEGGQAPGGLSAQSSVPGCEICKFRDSLDSPAFWDWIWGKSADEALLGESPEYQKLLLGIIPNGASWELLKAAYKKQKGIYSDSQLGIAVLWFGFDEITAGFDSVGLKLSVKELKSTINAAGKTSNITKYVERLITDSIEKFSKNKLTGREAAKEIVRELKTDLSPLASFYKRGGQDSINQAAKVVDELISKLGLDKNISVQQLIKCLTNIQKYESKTGMGDKEVIKLLDQFKSSRGMISRDGKLAIASPYDRILNAGADTNITGAVNELRHADDILSQFKTPIEFSKPVSSISGGVVKISDVDLVSVDRAGRIFYDDVKTSLGNKLTPGTKTTTDFIEQVEGFANAARSDGAIPRYVFFGTDVSRVSIETASYLRSIGVDIVDRLGNLLN